MPRTDIEQCPVPLPFSALPDLQYPTQFTAMFDYFATGQGRTVGVVIGYARTADDLRAKVLKHFDSYFAEGADVWPGVIVPDAVRPFLPPHILALCAHSEERFRFFDYASTFHQNLS